jgi:hypothetical protein
MREAPSLAGFTEKLREPVNFPEAQNVEQNCSCVKNSKDGMSGAAHVTALKQLVHCAKIDASST